MRRAVRGTPDGSDAQAMRRTADGGNARVPFVCDECETTEDTQGRLAVISWCTPGI